MENNEEADNRENIKENIKDNNIKENNAGESNVSEINIEKSSVEDVNTGETNSSDSSLFKFVDVFGEEHETEIYDNFPMKEYEDRNFYFESERTFYEDDEYYCRFGIDVSNKQKEINWQNVKEAGVEFAIIRLGYRGYGELGDIHLDLQFERNMKEAAELGIDIGVYFFSQAVNEEEAKEEAEFVLEHLKGYELQLPVVYDPESILDDEARTDNVTGAQFTKNTLLFCEMIEEAGYTPMIYSNMMWQAYQFDMDKLNKYDFWYADYEKLPQTPYAFTMWQYTENGYLDGISKKVDFDIQFIKK